MQLVDRPADHATALICMQPDLDGFNQREFRRLNLLLALRLRHQTVLAVCDNLQLRDWLVAQIEASVAGTVTVSLNLNDPDPIIQISRALSEARALHPEQHSPHLLQLTGIERLTHRSPYAQQIFLDRLQQTDSNHPTLREVTLLLWVTRPWLHAIQQAAPGFWQRHTAVFSFEGDPTPATGLLAPLPTSTVAPSILIPASAASMLSTTEPDEPVPASAPTQIQSLWELLNPDEQRPDPGAPVPPPPDPTADLPLDFPPSPRSSALSLPADFLSLVNLVSDQVQASDEPLIQALQQIQQFHQQSESQTELATAYHTFALLCRDRLEQVTPTLNDIELAIRAYQQALAYLDSDSLLRADILNDLGNLYWMESRHLEFAEQRQAALKQSIAVYQQALQPLQPQTQPQTYAMIQNNLGAAYADLAVYGNTAETLQAAIAAYEAALKYRGADTDPDRYAATQNNLGTAYWNLAQHQHPLHHLTQAIAAYQKALQYYTPEQEPLKHAMIQNNLGTTYWNLAQCEQLMTAQKQIGHPDLCQPLLKNAIAAYRTALLYRTPETNPVACATTCNNLGAAYWHLAMLDTTPPPEQFKYLQLASQAYTQALKLANNLEASQSLPHGFDPMSICNNLGLTFYHLAQQPQVESGKRLQLLMKALTYHGQAIQQAEPSSEAYELTFNYMIQSLRACSNAAGLQGQNQALSQIPASLLSEVMKRL